MTLKNTPRFATALFVLLAGLVSIQAVQESMSIVWQQSYGADNIEISYAVQPTKDNGLVLAGFTASKGNGAEDMWLVKLDNNGQQQWERTYGGSRMDVARHAIATRDGGYLVVGKTLSKGAGKGDIWLVRTDLNGQQVWEKTLGGLGNDEGYSAVQTKDGGFAVGGMQTLQLPNPKGSGWMQQQAMWLGKFDDKGNLQWEQTFHQSAYNLAHTVLETSGGDLLLVGNTLPNGKNMDTWVVKTDATGKKLWDKTYGGTKFNSTQTAVLTDNDGLVLAGTTNEQSLVGDAWVVRLGSDGRLLWEKIIGTDEYDTATGILLHTDQSMEIVTNVNSPKFQMSVWTITELDNQGKEKASKVFADQHVQQINAAAQTRAGDLILTGNARSTLSVCAGTQAQTDAWVMKLTDANN